MASLTVQAVQGLGAAPTLGAAVAGGDTTDLDANVRAKVVVGATATTITLTPAGPYIKGAPAQVFTGVVNATVDVRGWHYPGHKGRPKYGRLDITYSQVVGVTVGAYTNEGV